MQSMLKMNGTRANKYGAAKIGKGRLAAAAFIAALLCSSPALAGNAAANSFLDPGKIDLAVEIFTGKPTGAIGGARSRADSRLRLARCPRPLTAQWHGNRQNTVRVACDGASAWHIFVAIRAAPQSAKPKKPVNVVRRGDTVTIAVEGQRFTVRRPGQAQQPGAIGEWISVKTSRKAEPVSAKIVRPGLVVIPF